MTNLDYLYNPDAVKDKFDRNYFVDKRLGFSVIERGTVLPHKTISTNDATRRFWGAGGIVDSQGEFIRNTFAVNGRGEPYTPPTASDTALKPLFIWECFIPFGGTSYSIIFAACGF